jgi:hypothetical protein
MRLPGNKKETPKGVVARPQTDRRRTPRPPTLALSRTWAPTVTGSVAGADKLIGSVCKSATARDTAIQSPVHTILGPQANLESGTRLVGMRRSYRGPCNRPTLEMQRRRLVCSSAELCSEPTAQRDER